MAGLGRHYIWCKKDVVRTKEGYIDSSVGPNKDINICLHQGCSCSELMEKIAEISTIQADIRNQNGSVRRRSGSQLIIQEQAEEIRSIRRQRLQVAEEVIPIKRRQTEVVPLIRRRRVE